MITYLLLPSSVKTIHFNNCWWVSVVETHLFLLWAESDSLKKMLVIFYTDGLAPLLVLEFPLLQGEILPFKLPPLLICCVVC